MENLDKLQETDKGSEATGSKMSNEDIKAERLKIVELSNDSIMHGYDMAVDILVAAGSAEGAKILIENRTIIEVVLKNSSNVRASLEIEGNIGDTECQEE